MRIRNSIFHQTRKIALRVRKSANPDERFSTRVQRTLKVFGCSWGVANVQLNRSVIMEKFVLATRRFMRDEEGVTAIEYGLIAAGIAVAVIAVVFILGGKISAAFQSVANCLK